MSGVRKIGAINTSARKLPDADWVHDGTIPHLLWFRTPPDFRCLDLGTYVSFGLGHELLIAHEASRYGLHLPNRRDARA